MAEPTLLTVILNYKTADMTLRAATSALAAMEGLNGELIIVDNDSGDGSFEVMQAEADKREWRNVRVLQSGRNGGFGAGNNFGIKAGLHDGAAPDFVYILNSDAFPAEGAIRVLRDHLIDNPEVGLAGSYIHGEDGAPHVTAFRFHSVLGEAEGAFRFGLVSRLLKRFIVPLPVPAMSRHVDWLAGASMMMRREVFEDIGYFDERFFLYYEETDLCLRAAKAGWPTVYVRESEVAHIGSVSTGMKEWARVPDYWFNSRWHYFTKHHGRIGAIGATILHLLGGGFHRLRSLLMRRDAGMAPHFLRTLAAHDFGALFGRTAAPTPKTDSVRNTP